ncbi:MAG: M1 family aminopeptidase [Bacteroidales bacterium]
MMPEPQPSRAARRRMVASLVAAAILLLPVVPTHGGGAQSSSDGIARLLQRLQAAVLAGNPSGYVELIRPGADGASAKAFADTNIAPGATRVVVRERDRARLPGTPPDSAYRLAVDVFTEFGRRARLATWRVDIARQEAGQGNDWAITSQRSLSTFGALYRLSLAQRQFKARNLAIRAEDLELRLPDGWVFTADTDEGPTVLLLVGRGQMVFTPTPRTEREQMRIFCGADGIDTTFNAAFVRLSPAAVNQHLVRGDLEERRADPAAVRLAERIFREDNEKSFGIKLADLAPDNWSLVPGVADFLAEVHTRRFNTLSYAQSGREAEDVNLFDRAQRRNIALYTSRQKLAERGRFYDEGTFQSYDVLRYDIDTSIDPFRQTVSGSARLLVRIRGDAVSSITLKLAESVDVLSAASREHGRLIALRVRNQSSCVLNFPEALKKDSVVNLTLEYSGRVPAQYIDREAIGVGDGPQEQSDQQELPTLLEPSYLYSNRGYWYPQSETSGFATGTLRVRVPPTYTCAASGDPVSGTTVAAATPRGFGEPFVFHVLQPVRYLSVLITRLLPVRPMEVVARLGDEAQPWDRSGVYYKSIQMQSFATPRMRGRAQTISTWAIDVLRFYASLMNDCPYPTLTLAVTERELPGGHSPGFLVVLAEPVLSTPFRWKADPTNFAEFPEFFLAHELAHQWWGQAVGWKNYHEQWLSEGLSQYFAALYAERLHGKAVFDGIIGRMQEWALKKSSEGPVYLGYRIGHVKRDPQLFRAIVYNKSAAVLHMLRRLLGDDAFFRGLRRFYAQWRFRKAGSDDLRAALEAESGQSLSRFFDRWIYDSRVPRLKFSWRSEPATGGGTAVALRFDQVGEVFDLPVTVTLDYADRQPTDIVVKITQATTELRVPVEGRLVRVEVNRDHAAVARIEK